MDDIADMGLFSKRHVEVDAVLNNLARISKEAGWPPTLTQNIGKKVINGVTAIQLNEARDKIDISKTNDIEKVRNRRLGAYLWRYRSLKVEKDDLRDHEAVLKNLKKEVTGSEGGHKELPRMAQEISDRMKESRKKSKPPMVGAVEKQNIGGKVETTAVPKKRQSKEILRDARQHVPFKRREGNLSDIPSQSASEISASEASSGGENGNSKPMASSSKSGQQPRADSNQERRGEVSDRLANGTST